MNTNGHKASRRRALLCANVCATAVFLVSERSRKPFDSKQAWAERLGKANLIAVNDFDVKSAWFSVLVRVQQDDVLLGAEALVKREDIAKGGVATVVWRRPLY